MWYFILSFIIAFITLQVILAVPKWREAWSINLDKNDIEIGIAFIFLMILVLWPLLFLLFTLHCLSRLFLKLNEYICFRLQSREMCSISQQSSCDQDDS